MPFHFLPKEFVRVRAYLLDADIVPRSTVVIGLDAIRNNFGLSVHLNGDFLSGPGYEAIPLRFRQEVSDRDPGFLIPRLRVDVLLEQERMEAAKSFFANAVVDTGSPYVVLPHRFHTAAKPRIYTDLGQHLYRVSSMSGARFQPFAEVGLKFFVES
jgi:hypothetical protein